MSFRCSTRPECVRAAACGAYRTGGTLHAFCQWLARNIQALSDYNSVNFFVRN